jgi:cyclase
VNIRIISRLDIKGPNLVKGIHLEGLRVLGKPEDFARFYYQTGADELIYQDAVASLYGRNSLLDIIERTATKIFIPLTVGGGLRSVEDIRTVLRAGADKVAINTAAVQRPELIREAVLAFGSSTIVVSIEAIRNPDGSYEAYVDYGRESTGVDAFEWALKAVELGAGELLVTSIDQDGTGKGYDLELTRRIAEAVPIPVIALGGAGNLAHIDEVIKLGRADAVSLASMLHYEFIHQYQFREDDYQMEGNIEFLRGQRGDLGRRHIEGTTVGEVKAFLAAQGVKCRGLSAG